MAGPRHGPRRRLRILTVLISLALFTSKHVPTELCEKRDTGLAQEIDTRAYLATGDFNHLKNPHQYGMCATLKILDDLIKNKQRKKNINT